MATKETPEEKAKREQRARERTEKDAAQRAEQEAKAAAEAQQIVDATEIRNRYAARVDLIRAHGTPEDLKEACEALQPVITKVQARL